jgi:OFA family oxalate/formate antiporter-like MFS transporter
MLSKGRFWLLYLLYICGAFSGLMFVSQAKPIANAALKSIIMDPVALGKYAGFVVMVIAIANATGRIIWGTISDWIGRQWALVLMFLITTIAMFLMPSLVTGKSTILLGAVLIGACFGGYLGTFPPICADSFGAKNMAVNYALLFSAFAVAALIGPQVAAYIQKTTGGYDLAYKVAGTVSLLGLFVSTAMTRSKPALVAETQKA